MEASARRKMLNIGRNKNYFHKFEPILNKSGIYLIYCKTNDKFYVGKTKRFKDRRSSHLSGLRNNKHDNVHLQNAWNKYGSKSFSFILVMLCELGELSFYEEKIASLFKEEDLFNLDTIGVSFKRRKEVLEKTSQKLRGRKASAETIAKLRAAGKRKIPYRHTEKDKIKMREKPKAFGERSGASKLKRDQVISIKEEYMNGASIETLSSKYHTCQNNVLSILHGITWKSVPFPIGFRLKNPYGKLAKEQVLEVRRLCLEGLSYSKVGKLFGISGENVSDIHKRKIWKKI